MNRPYKLSNNNIVQNDIRGLFLLYPTADRYSSDSTSLTMR